MTLEPRTVLEHLDELEAVDLGLEGVLRAEEPAAVVVKEDAELHRAIAKALDAGELAQEFAAYLSLDLPLSAPSGKEYMEGFVTTIGRSIALPRADFARERVGARILTKPHEWQHVRQHAKGVAAGWWPEAVSHSVLYLAGVLRREEGAEYVGKVEGDAYAVTEFLRFWFTGAARPQEYVADLLARQYNLIGIGTDVARGVLLPHYRSILRGEAPNVWAARLAGEFLDTNFPHLRGAFASFP